MDMTFTGTGIKGWAMPVAARRFSASLAVPATPGFILANSAVCKIVV
jgi:hypothetical protein